MERLTEKVFAFNGTSCMQIKDCDNDTCEQTCRSRTGSEGCEGCPIQIAIDKLAEYEDLEEQGKLLKLPCKIGQRVYMIYQFCGEGAWEVEEHKIKLEDLENIGKTVFLTRPDAEQALAEMEGKK